MMRLEPFGCSVASSSAAGLFPSCGSGGFVWVHAKTAFSKAGCVWSTEVHHWGSPWDRVMPEMLIHLWAQHGSAALDLSLTPLVAQRARIDARGSVYANFFFFK